MYKDTNGKWKRHELYDVWHGMKQRCYYENSDTYKNYGGRGITVCDEWIDSSNSFYSWAYKNGWCSDLQIDRIDNDGNYSPDNCQFISQHLNLKNKRLIQSNNKSGYRGVFFNKSCNKWSAVVGVNGRRKYVGYFIDVVEAAKARDKYIIDNDIGLPLNF